MNSMFESIIKTVSNPQFKPEVMLFSDMNLQPNLLKSLQKIGYEKPTMIQKAVIPFLMGHKNHDLVALAQTGSGKTAAFGIPLAEKLDPNLKELQALVLSPTRELALQIQQSLNSFLEPLGYFSMTVYGGQSYTDQKAKLKRKPQIIIATPGRLVDLLNQKCVDLTNLKALVLDEADRMLSMGFEEELQFILAATKSVKEETKSKRASCQTWLFSATMGPGIKRILNQYLDTPHIVEQVDENKGVSDTLEHKFLAVKSGNKPQALMRILQSFEDFYGIVFCQTKKDVSDLEDILKKNNIQCMSLHGDKVQKDREKIVKALKDGKISVLIATDVAARGIDIKNLKHVVHYSLPYELESYIHRSGRTGRNGEEGMVISLLEPSQFSTWNRIAKATGIKSEKLELKNINEILKSKVMSQLSSLKLNAKTAQLFAQTKEICEEIIAEMDTDFTTVADWLAAVALKNIKLDEILSDEMIIQDFNTGKSKKSSSGGRSFSRDRRGDDGGYRRRDGRSDCGERTERGESYSDSRSDYGNRRASGFRRNDRRSEDGERTERRTSDRRDSGYGSSTTRVASSSGEGERRSSYGGSRGPRRSSASAARGESSAASSQKRFRDR